MMRLYRYMLVALSGIILFAGCNKMDEFERNDILEKDIIAPACLFEDNGRMGYSSGRIGTKMLINQTSNTDTILCNFLRIEEVGGSFSAQDSSVTTNWGKAYLSEGTISTIANINNDYLRSISLHPEQPYNTQTPSTRSRMIGWYPRTDGVPQTATGTDVTIQYENFTGTYVKENERIGVRFTGLDGSKDIMVSDVRDGSYNNPFSSTSTTTPKNYFTFKHYLSAVRVHAKAERSPQDIGMWGEIEEVVIMGQPTSCVVELPQTPEITNSTQIMPGNFGEVITWGTENAKFPIQKTHIFGEHDTDYPDNIMPEEYPIILEGNSAEHYLGYSLVQPKCSLRIQIHTTAGVYNVVIPNKYKKDEASAAQDIFEAGYIYDIHLNFKTDGTIMAFLENEGAEKYFDLTTGHEYSIDNETVYDYKWANCYIIDAAPKSTNANATVYDGFCFDATVVGNGQNGIISTGAQILYPQNAHIEPVDAEVLWQSSPRLVSQIELLFGHVRFKVAKETENTYKEGNAVIAVYDKDKKVLWSWHIWITDKPQNISYKEDTTRITIMDRNLGALFGEIPQNDTQALESYGLYYQWGRKDPSMGPPRWDYSPINMTTAPFYDYSSDEKNSAEVMRFAAPTLKDAVENPMYLLMPTALTQTYYFNWLYEKIDFLWGYSKTTGETHKSIYDPCPYGYRVSGGELADLFTYASTDGTINTTNSYGQVVTVPDSSKTSASESNYFFPYSGFKGVDRGLNSLVSSWKYVGKKGDYQSSIVSMYTDDEEYYMHRSRIYLSKDRTWNELNVGDYTGHQIQDHTNRRTAAPVRCVKDENHKRLMAFITPNKYTIASAADNVNLTLYAYSFGGNVVSATLSIGYHMKDNDGSEGAHQEYVIKEWNASSAEQPTNNKIWNATHLFTFNTIKALDANGNKTETNIDINNTTGEFRFILRVKSADNINKMSSTTIRLAKNSVDFSEWEADNEVFQNIPVTRKFRIYGDSEPTGIEIKIIDPEENETTANGYTYQFEDIPGSEYEFDRNCIINGLSFSELGTNKIKFIITFDNDNTKTLTTEPKEFNVIQPASPVKITELNQISSDKYYLIKSINVNGYAYDGNEYLKTSTEYNDINLFKIIATSGGYLIQNKQSGDYVNIDNRTLKIQTDKQNSAAVFTIEDKGDYFKLGTKLRNNHTYLSYWQQQQIGNNIAANSDLNNQNPESQRWEIYEVPDATTQSQ